MTLGDSIELCDRIARLGRDEQEILLLLLERLESGRRIYGEWQIPDARDYAAEALSEVLDALHYCAAQTLKMRALTGG
jgi:hypothetical protein